MTRVSPERSSSIRPSLIWHAPPSPLCRKQQDICNSTLDFAELSPLGKSCSRRQGPTSREWSLATRLCFWLSAAGPCREENRPLAWTTQIITLRLSRTHPGEVTGPHSRARAQHWLIAASISSFPATRIGHAGSGPAWQTAAINDQELTAFAQRMLCFTRRRESGDGR